MRVGLHPNQLPKSFEKFYCPNTIPEEKGVNVFQMNWHLFLYADVCTSLMNLKKLFENPVNQHSSIVGTHIFGLDASMARTDMIAHHRNQKNTHFLFCPFLKCPWPARIQPLLGNKYFSFPQCCRAWSVWGGRFSYSLVLHVAYTIWLSLVNSNSSSILHPVRY